MAPSSTFSRLLARVLPSEFRERVFEPAWADIVLEEGAGPRSRGTVFRARAVLLVECLRLGLPQWVWHRGRATRLARRAMGAVAIAAVLRILLNVAYWRATGR